LITSKRPLLRDKRLEKRDSKSSRTSLRRLMIAHPKELKKLLIPRRNRQAQPEKRSYLS
jgi:hypothetical protein